MSLSDEEPQAARKRSKTGHLRIDEGASGDYGVLAQIIRHLGNESRTFKLEIDKDDERVRSLDFVIFDVVKEHIAINISVSILDDGDALKQLSISSEAEHKGSTRELAIAGEIENLRSLEVLEINYSKPDTANLIKLLREGKRDRCHLRNLPNEIGNLTNLKVLRISESKMPSLPATIGNLISLEELSIKSDGDMETLPDAIENLTNLKKLVLNSCEIRSLPDSICNLSSLEELHLRNTAQLKSLPNAIGNLTNLKYMNIEYSGISSLPESVHKLLNLEVLNICEDSYQIRIPVATLTSMVQHCPYLGIFCFTQEAHDIFNDLIRCLLRRNKIRCRIFRKPSPPPLSLWPLIFKMVGHRSSYLSEYYVPKFLCLHRRFLDESSQGDVIFWLLKEHCEPIFARASNESQSIAP